MQLDTHHEAFLLGLAARRGWEIETLPRPLDRRGFKVIDANGQSLAYVYASETKAQADTAKVLTTDEARRVASNIAKLPALSKN